MIVGSDTYIYTYSCMHMCIMQIASQVYTRFSDMCCTNKSAWQLCCTYQSQCWGLVRAHGYTTATMVGGQMSWLALKQLCTIPWCKPGGHQHQPLAECPLHQSVHTDWQHRADCHHPVQWESMKWRLLPVFADMHGYLLAVISDNWRVWKKSPW